MVGDFLVIQMADVNDGSRIVQTNWSVNVAAYRAPRFLFDETGAQRRETE